MFKIKELEKKLGKKIKRNTASFGFDGALIKSGYCIIKSNTSNLIIIDSGVIVHKNYKVITDKLNLLKNTLKKIKIPESKNKVAVIEMPYMGMNAHTGIMLGLADGLAYSIISNKIPYTFFLSAISARSRIGFKPRKRTKEEIKKGIKKVNTKKAVAEYVKNKIGFVSKSDDIVDAFVLALSGLIN